MEGSVLGKRKAYIVTSGEYSDYGIDMVFLSEEKAMAWCNMMGSGLDDGERDPAMSSYRIEEYAIGDGEELPPLEKAGICGIFRDDELVLFGVFPAYFEPLRFSQRRMSSAVTFEGDLRMRNGESLDKFRGRAKKAVIDKYFRWKLGRRNKQ